MAARRIDLLGAAAGLALGAADTALLALSGVEMTFAGESATLVVGATFMSSLGLLGFLAGRLAQARAREREAAETIRRQKEALAASERAALESEKLAALGRLAAGIAHEVRNPLGVIRASAALVRDHFGEGEDAHRACRFIVEETDRLDGLIAALLAFARPAPLRARETKVADVVERAARLAEEVARRHEVELVASPGDAGACEISVDPDLIAQVLLGLVTNAAEAVGRGGRVRVLASASEQEVALAVADDGPGVPEAESARIFEPFYTTKERGTGLGLAMAERIARAHGGALRLERGAGCGPGGAGACFVLALPRAGAAAGVRRAAAGARAA